MSKKQTYWTIEVGFYSGILLGIRTYKDNDFISIHVLYIPFVDIAFKYINDVEKYNKFVSATNEAVE